jgi:hypothetical protein
MTGVRKMQHQRRCPTTISPHVHLSACPTNKHHRPGVPKTDNAGSSVPSSTFLDGNKKSPQHPHSPLFSLVITLSFLLCVSQTFLDNERFMSEKCSPARTYSKHRRRLLLPSRISSLQTPPCIVQQIPEPVRNGQLAL